MLRCGTAGLSYRWPVAVPLACRHRPKIFNNDSTLTSAVLDRLLHHAETVIVEGRSYRMKDQIETP